MTGREVPTTLDNMQNPIHYAGFARRALADCVDSLFLNIVTCLVVFMTFGLYTWGLNFQLWNGIGALSSLSVQLSLVAIRFLLSLVYFTWGTFRFGTTLGKALVRVSVVSVDSHSRISFQASFIRFLAYGLSYMPLGAGFLMVAFQPEKRGLHDLAARTVTIVQD